MKARFIWRYTTTNYAKDGDYSYWGTCEKWAKETFLMPGQKMVKTRILWVGKPPVCNSCLWGFH